MCDQDHFEKDRQEYESLGLVTRRQFGVMLGAGMAMMLPKVANAVTVAESDVSVMTPDGTADCYFVHPATGTAPGVLVWPDIFGLRPAFRQMSKRLAESGYSVLVVNPFYRVKKAPTAEAGSATPIQQLLPLAQALTETTHMSSNDSNFVEPGAIPWLLLQVVGTGTGPTGGAFLTQATFIQRLNTSGGVAPATGCSSSGNVGAISLVPYTADYFFYKASH